MKNTTTICTALLLLTAIAITANAQKLPRVQKQSVRAPALIKVDGKATEWNNQLQAFNKALNLTYTLANNDKLLYLTVQATDHTIINKILGGGLTFIIYPSGKRNAKNGVNITYPVLDKNNRVWVNLKARPEIIPDSAITVRQADTFMNVNNTRFLNKSKLIMVTGLKDVDTLISIFNTDGIKAAALFDNKMVYTYELTINLEKLGLTVTNLPKISYDLKLDGVDINALRRENAEIAERIPRIAGRPAPPAAPISLPPRVIMDEFTSPTYLEGEYTLTK